MWKVKWFVLLIFIFHAFTGEDNIKVLVIQRWKWTLGLSYEGMLIGAIMSCKLIAMLLITQTVRFSMKKNEFVLGLLGLGLSRSNSQIIDQIIEVVNSEKKGNGNGKGKGKNKNPEKKGETRAIDVLFKGQVGNLPKKLVNRLNFAADKFKNNPNATIASSTLAITLIRMVKIAPGLPLAPGHKNILVIPVFIHGIHKSEKKLAGLQIGSISGILHFSMGFGKFGPLGILEFGVLGLVIDLMLKLPVKKTNLLYLMAIGAIGGLTRIATEIALAYILGMTSVFYILYLPYIISQISFGIASGFISRALLKTNDNNE